MHLFIHTYGRSTRQTTLSFLTAVPKDRIFLVVQAREAHLYAKYAQQCHGVLALPDEIRTLSPTRQWIMDHALSVGMPKVCLLDDDLRFNVRGPPSAAVQATPFTLWVATPEQTAECLDLLDGWLDTVAHCGLSAREGNNRIEAEVTEVGRMMRLLAYRTDVYHDVGARFDRIATKQDFDVTLQLLRAGYPNRISWKYATGQASGSGAKGGCAVYRTKEMMDRCAHELAALHPGFVKVVEKETKTSFGGGVRSDVVIAWQKAYKSSEKSII